MYPLIMGFKGTEFEVVNFYEKASAKFPPGLPKLGILNCTLYLTIDWARGVDGERYIEIIKPIPTTSEGKNFELRRETAGAYDKGRAGLVLEEKTLLVNADSGDVYTKMVGSSFFVGQVQPPGSATDGRADMTAPQVPKSQVIRLQRENNLIKLPNSKQVLDNLYYIA